MVRFNFGLNAFRLAVAALEGCKVADGDLAATTSTADLEVTASEDTPHRRTGQVALGFLAAAALMGCKGADDIDTGAPDSGDIQVYINEIMASNATTLEDNGTFPDWIELYNAGSGPANLEGFWITDDAADPFKHQLGPGVSIAGGGYLILFADSDGDEGETHLSFNLDQLGGDVALFGINVDDNPLIDKLEAYSELAADVSLARQPDATGNWETDATPTPGAQNQ